VHGAVAVVVLVRSFHILDQDRVSLHDVGYFHRFGDMCVMRDEEVREASVGALRAAVGRLRPTSASVHENAMHDPRFYTNPEQVLRCSRPIHARLKV